MTKYFVCFAVLVFFQSVDWSGSMSIGGFVSVQELKENPLVNRVVDIFESDLNGKVNFDGKT